jgi:agmatine deiminase
MITDKDTNFVYLSSLIKARPELRNFWRGLVKTLNKAGIPYGFIENTNDLWCRDYMPIQLSKTDFVQFTFNPAYYHPAKWRHLLTNTKQLNVETAPRTAILKSSLVVDGGNLIRSRNTVILTDRIFKENTAPQEHVVQQLRETLQVEHLHIIPALPYEVSGHADGMVRLLDDSTLLVADYHTESPSWRAKYDRSLKNTDLRIIHFPNVATDIKNNEGEHTALGCYINFAWIGNIILFPQFDMQEDKEALREAKKILSDYVVLPVPVSELAMSCGVLNCATWNVEL